MAEALFNITAKRVRTATAGRPYGVTIFKGRSFLRSLLPYHLLAIADDYALIVFVHTLSDEVIGCTVVCFLGFHRTADAGGGWREGESVEIQRTGRVGDIYCAGVHGYGDDWVHLAGVAVLKCDRRSISFLYHFVVQFRLVLGEHQIAVGNIFRSSADAYL